MELPVLSGEKITMKIFEDWNLLLRDSVSSPRLKAVKIMLDEAPSSLV